MIEAAALHPHATRDALTALGQCVRLGVAASAKPAAAADIADRLAYVERGLTILALEKSAQLLQVGLFPQLLLLLLAPQLLLLLLQLEGLQLISEWTRTWARRAAFHFIC